MNIYSSSLVDRKYSKQTRYIKSGLSLSDIKTGVLAKIILQLIMPKDIYYTSRPRNFIIIGYAEAGNKKIHSICSYFLLKITHEAILK